MTSSGGELAKNLADLIVEGGDTGVGSQETKTTPGHTHFANVQVCGVHRRMPRFQGRWILSQRTMLNVDVPRKQPAHLTLEGRQSKCQ